MNLIQKQKFSDYFDLPLVTVCPSSSVDILGISTYVLPQNEVYRTVLPPNEIGSMLQIGVFEFSMPQNRVFHVCFMSN